MATVTRWLKWNGVYDLAGICNQPLTPLDSTTEPIKAIKERLYLLGFKCGGMDNTLNNETKRALLTFNGYWDHQDIHRLADTAAATFPAAYHDPATIKCLKDLEDTWPPPPVVVPTTATVTTTVQVSRNRLGRTGYSTTLNTSTSLAVKVVATPKSLVPFAEYAALEIEIKGWEKVKSLLLRIYRNFDPTTDQVAIAGDKIIYQEILDERALQALAAKGPKRHTGPHHEAKAFIMRQEVGGGFGGSFRNFFGVAYERIHAPYIVRVWVSTIDKFFDSYAFKPTDEDKASRKAANEKFNLHYLDDQEREAITRGRQQALTSKGMTRGGLHRNEPDINHMETVHDKSNLAPTDASESPVVKTSARYWSQLTKWNAALKQAKHWTAKDAQAINLIAEPCADHPPRFLLDNIIQKETFPDTFAKDPVGTYMALRANLDRDGTNFACAELKEVLDNVRRHLNSIKRRVCCGQWAQLAEAIRGDAVSFIEHTIEPELDKLVKRNYPYDDSLYFMNSFMAFFSALVHYAVVEPELDYFTKFSLQPTRLLPTQNNDTQGLRDFGKYLGQRRGKIDGFRSEAFSEFGMTGTHIYPGGKLSQFFEADGFGYPQRKDKTRTSGVGYPRLRIEIADKQQTTGQMVGKAILIPSYNPLNAYYFVTIRAVPLFLVGMLDMQYLNADGIRQIPVGFFEHDLFHVETGQKQQQWETLYNRLCNVIAQSKSTTTPLTEENVYRKWQKNIKTIDDLVALYTDKKEQNTLKFLLFWLLHEPKSGSVYEWLKKKGVAPDEANKFMRTFPYPALPEAALLSERLSHGHKMALQNIRQEDETDFFGVYSHPLMEKLDWAASILEMLFIPLMDDLP
jgi:hypothetical protein